MGEITEKFKRAGSYARPIGRGWSFLPNSNTAVNAVLGGWRFTGNLSAQSGVPLYVSEPCNGLTCRPNLVGDPSLSHSRPKTRLDANWVNSAHGQPVYGNAESVRDHSNPYDPRSLLFGT